MRAAITGTTLRHPWWCNLTIMAVAAVVAAAAAGRPITGMEPAMDTVSAQPATITPMAAPSLSPRAIMDTAGDAAAADTERCHNTFRTNSGWMQGRV